MLFVFLYPQITFAITKYNEESIRYTVSYFFDDLGNTENMLKIIECESNYNNLAINHEDAKITGKKSYGLFQVNGYFLDWEIPYNNIKRAKEIYKKQGYRAWFNCSKKYELI